MNKIYLFLIFIIIFSNDYSFDNKNNLKKIRDLYLTYLTQKKNFFSEKSLNFITFENGVLLQDKLKQSAYFIITNNLELSKVLSDLINYKENNNNLFINEFVIKYLNTKREKRTKFEKLIKSWEIK